MSDQRQKSDLVEIGALWAKDSRAGNRFLSGKVGTPYKTEGVDKDLLSALGKLSGINVTVLKNNFKTEGDNKPEYKIFISSPVNDQQIAAKTSEEF